MVKILLSKLVDLKVDEEFQIETDGFLFCFKKIKIFDSECLVFGYYGGGLIFSEKITENYKDFIERINRKYCDIEIELEVDMEIDE